MNTVVSLLGILIIIIIASVLSGLVTLENVALSGVFLVLGFMVFSGKDIKVVINGMTNKMTNKLTGKLDNIGSTHPKSKHCPDGKCTDKNPHRSVIPQYSECPKYSESDKLRDTLDYMAYEQAQEDQLLYDEYNVACENQALYCGADDTTSHYKDMLVNQDNNRSRWKSTLNASTQLYKDINDAMIACYPSPAYDTNKSDLYARMNYDELNTHHVRSRERRKKQMDGAISKTAEYYKKHFAHELDKEERLQWWGNYDY